MRSKTKTLIETLVLGGLLAGSLVTSAVPVVAQDYWRWHERDYQWERRKDLLSEQIGSLDQARRQLEYDRSHHARRRTIAQDEARIRNLERDTKDYPSENDRRGNWD